MNGNNNGPGSEVAIGGALVAIILLVVVFKALKEFFIELGHAMDAFGVMAHSFVFMLWNVAQVVFLVSVTIASLLCAVYFTIRYFQMVRDAVAIREDVNMTVDSLRESVETKFLNFTRDVQIEVYRIDKRLTDAMAKANAETTASSSQSSSSGSSDVPKASAETDIHTHDSQPDDLKAATAVSSNLDTNTEVTMSNPL